MANINLSTDQLKQYDQKSFSAQTGLIIGVSILLIVVVLCAGLTLWRNNLNKKIAAAEDSYNIKRTALMSGRNLDVIDFQNRIMLAKDLVKQRNAAVDTLQNIEKNLVAGVYLTSYKVDKETKMIELECVADNFDSIAKQILGFKSSEYFPDVAIKDAGISNEGKNTFSINIKFK